MQRAFITTAILALAAAAAAAQEGAYALPDGTPDNVRRAVESGERSDDDRARDATRRPAEVLTLAGIDDGDEIVEFASFGHYYTRLLADAVGADGHVYMVDMPWTDRFGGEGARSFEAEHANATYMQVHYNEMSLPEGLDAALMVLFYHDLVRDEAEQSVDTADMNRRIFEALDSGGRFVVVDHRAADGSGWRDATTLHRIDAQTIVDEVTAAGFELVENSALLANAGDDRTLNMRDPAIRGRTDRAVLVFEKP